MTFLRKARYIHWESAKGYYPQLMHIRESKISLEVRSRFLLIQSRRKQRKSPLRVKSVSFPRSVVLDKSLWFPLSELILIPGWLPGPLKKLYQSTCNCCLLKLQDGETRLQDPKLYLSLLVAGSLEERVNLHSLLLFYFRISLVRSIHWQTDLISILTHFSFWFRAGCLYIVI